MCNCVCVSIYRYNIYGNGTHSAAAVLHQVAVLTPVFTPTILHQPILVGALPANELCLKWRLSMGLNTMVLYGFIDDSGIILGC